MNLQIIKSRLISLLGPATMSYVQAWRFVYLLKTNRCPEPEFLFARRFLQLGQTAIDVGANGANWTHCLHQCVGPGGRVFAFEADPYYALATQRAIRILRLEHVQLFSFGLSDKDEEVVLRVANSSGVRHRGMGHVDRNAQVDETGVEIVRLKRLDSMIVEHPAILESALIKCDVEGYELFVFRGANEVIDKSRAVVILEVGNYEKQGYSPRDVYTLFSAKDYLPFALTDGNTLGATDDMLSHDRAVSPNRILVPREKLRAVGDAIRIDD